LSQKNDHKTSRTVKQKSNTSKAAKNRQSIVVNDVYSFPEHIACDPASNSKIVIPLIYQGKLFGVLDIDSPSLNRFSTDDKNCLEELVDTLMNYSDMSSLKNYYKV